MQFDFSQICHNWTAHGAGDRVYTVNLLMTGYFKAEGPNATKVCRTHFDAVQACEHWEDAALADEQNIFSESEATHV